MAKNWTDLRKEMIAGGQIDEAKSAEHQRRMLAEVRAHRLAEIRKAQSLTQVEVAKLMDVDQSRISRLEAGRLDTTELGTVKKYIEALGGQLRVIADFGVAGLLPIADLVVEANDRVSTVEIKVVRKTPPKATPSKDVKAPALAKAAPRHRRTRAAS